MAPNQQKLSRIPLPLQVIFLHSNRGFKVDKPPPERLASKVFRRGLFFKKPIDRNSKSEADNTTTEEATSIQAKEENYVSSACKGNAEEQLVTLNEEQAKPLKQEGLSIADEKSKTSALTELEEEDDDEEDDSKSEREETDNNDGSDQDYSGNQSDSDFVFAAYEAEMEGLLQLLDFRLQSSRHLLST
jgi:actin-related protein